MNNMNKVLIEGKILLPSVDYVNDDVYFTIRTTRFYKKDGKGVTDEQFIPVKAESKLRELTRTKLAAGRNEVRIEGRLEGLMVVAQFIEFKKDYVTDVSMVQILFQYLILTSKVYLLNM